MSNKAYKILLIAIIATSIIIGLCFFTQPARAERAGQQLFATTFDGTEMEFDFWTTLDACTTCKRPGDVDRQVHVALYDPTDTKVYDGGRVHNPYDFQPFVWNTAYSTYWTDFPYWFSTQIGLGTPDTGNYYFQFDIEAWNYGSPSTIESQWFLNMTYNGTSWTTDSEIPIDGYCGTADNTIVYAEPSGAAACASGSLTSMTIGQNEQQTETFFNWICQGANGGVSSTCNAIMGAPINGDCGTANGQSLSAPPDYEEMCNAGFNGGSLVETLDGWNWSCYGFNGGTTDFCSATNTGAATPPTIPGASTAPTPEDCNTYTGLDYIVCNISNTIQGMFLPSVAKQQELQTTINQTGNIFPFNYLRAAATALSNLTTPTSTAFTMTLMGTTQTIDTSLFTGTFFTYFKLFTGFLILLIFIFWAVGYIKHFFK